MAVIVPLHLLRRESRQVCTALLLLTHDTRELLALCGRVGTDPLPPIYPVADGFLVIPEEIPTSIPSKTIRLRRLSENCFVPADAELVPALLPDELADLTRQRGLVFLPGDRCLAYQPDQPVAAVDLLQFAELKRELWRPFPSGVELASHLTTITRVVPEINLDEIFDSGGSGIGEKPPPRPPKVGPIKTTAGRMKLGLGKGLAALGSAFGIGTLARLGANMIAGAIAAVPRLSESLLGKQEAALRELLRRFREGRIDDALKNALPMGGQNREGNLHTTDELPTHNIRWSLSSLTGSNGPASFWVGGEEVQRDLMNEYRKAAQAALAQGDHRRAAFIYAKLLGELDVAADALSKGGLHRDAAIVYRDLLKRPRWAAREFEAAGEWDEALRLYRQSSEHEQAGDLLHRMGNEEEAIAEYHIAATKIVDAQHDYLKAGNLIFSKTGSTDLARAYFASGWRERKTRLALANNAIPCAMRLAEIDAFSAPLQPLWTLIDEVDEWVRGPEHLQDAANFFSAIAKLADLPHLKDHRAELRDRCRLALAAKLRAHLRSELRSNIVVSVLLGSSGQWPAAVVSDANFAVRAELKRAGPLAKIEHQFKSVRLGNGTVTAAVCAPASGDIVVGMNNGAVVALDPSSGRITQIAPTGRAAVESIAVDPTGLIIVTAAAESPERLAVHLCGFRRNESGQMQFLAERTYPLRELGWSHLTPLILRSGSAPTTFLSTPGGLVQFRAMVLVPYEILSDDEPHSPCYLTLTAPFQSQSTSRTDPNSGAVVQSGASIPVSTSPHSTRILVEDHTVRWTGERIDIGWRPGEGALDHPSISWLQTAADRLEIAGISDRVICWSHLTAPDSKYPEAPRTLNARHHEGYVATAIWKPGRLIGVTTANRICWLRAGSTEMREWAVSVTIPVPSKAVACFPSHKTNEALVLLADGELIRVPVPK